MTTSSIICTLQHNCDHIKDDKMGGTYIGETNLHKVSVGQPES